MGGKRAWKGPRKDVLPPSAPVASSALHLDSQLAHSTNQLSSPLQQAHDFLERGAGGTVGEEVLSWSEPFPLLLPPMQFLLDVAAPAAVATAAARVDAGAGNLTESNVGDSSRELELPFPPG